MPTAKSLENFLVTVANCTGGGFLISSSATQTLSIFIKLYENTFLGMPKVRAWSVNFYIANALGQNLANSESCPTLRLL